MELVFKSKIFLTKLDSYWSFFFFIAIELAHPGHFFPCDIDLLKTESNTQPFDTIYSEKHRKQGVALLSCCDWSLSNPGDLSCTGIFPLHLWAHSMSLLKFELKVPGHVHPSSHICKFSINCILRKIFQIPSLSSSFFSTPIIITHQASSQIFFFLEKENSLNLLTPCICNSFTRSFIIPFCTWHCSQGQAGKQMCKAVLAIHSDSCRDDAQLPSGECLLSHTGVFVHICSL